GLIESKRELVDAIEAKIPDRDGSTHARMVRSLASCQRALDHRHAFEVIAIFIGAVGDGLADFQCMSRVQNAFDRVRHKIADAGRQPMPTAQEHNAVGTDVESLERIATDELL